MTSTIKSKSLQNEDIPSDLEARKKDVDLELDPASYIAFRKQKYNTRWKQQKNIAFRQDLSFVHILIFYLVLGSIFLAIGLACYFSAAGHPKPVRAEYTDCKDARNGITCASIVKHTEPNTDCQCEVSIQIDEKLAKAETLILFYELDNYHQNTRDYKKDIDWEQLEGRAIQGSKAVEPKCYFDPFKVKESGSVRKYIYPCGKIANSLFSDQFKMIYQASATTVSWEEKGIAWSVDKPHFKSPKITPPQTIEDFFELPKDWHNELKEYFKQNKMVENEHFMVWVRSAAFRLIRKKYAVIKGKDIEKGTYTIKIDYRYEVNSFNGKKFLVIRGDGEDIPVDFVFAYSYLGVACVCFALGPLFFLVKCIFKTHLKRKYTIRLVEKRKSVDASKNSGDVGYASQDVTAGPTTSNLGVAT